MKDIKRKYITGIIGAIIGGAIACIPLVYCYVYQGIFLSMLTILVPIGAIYGYSFGKGKINNQTMLINLIVTIFIISIALLLVVPALTLQVAEYPVSFKTIKQLYTYNEFSPVIIRNYLISEIFAILGSILIGIKLSYQLVDYKKRKDFRIFLLEEVPLKDLKQEAIRVVKPIFKKYNAVSQENAIIKEEVLAEIDDKSAKEYFNYLKDINIIKKYQGKFFYVDENEKNEKVKNRGLKAGVSIVIALILATIVTMSTNIVQSEKLTVWDENIKFEMDRDWSILDSYNRETGWSYYKYISNEPEDKNSESTSKSDYPAIIQVYYEKDIKESQTVEEMKEKIERYIQDKLVPDIYYINEGNTDRGYKLINAKIQYLSEEYVETEILYYLVDNDRIIYITAVTYNQDDNEELEEYINDLANSAQWE